MKQADVLHVQSVSLTTFLLFLSQTEVSHLQSERDELTTSTSTKDATLQVLNQYG